MIRTFHMDIQVAEITYENSQPVGVPISAKEIIKNDLSICTAEIGTKGLCFEAALS